MAKVPGNGRLVIIAVALCVILIPLNSTMIAVGLVPIAQGLGVPVSSVVWAVTIYLVIMAALQPISGKIGDTYGRRRLITIGLWLFLASSAGAALIPHLWALMVFRAGQGLAGALIAPNATGVLRQTFAGDALRRTLGIVGMLQGLSAACGPLIGAVMVHWGGWAAIFWVNVPVVLVAIVIAKSAIPIGRPLTRPQIDFRGAIALAGFLACLALSLPRGGVNRLPETMVPIACCVLAVFVFWERRAKNPLVQFSLFRRPAFLNANLAILFSNFFMYATLLYMPIYFHTRGLSTVADGVLLFVFSFSMSLMALGGSWASRLAGSRAAIGLAFVMDLLAVLWYVALGPHSSLAFIAAGMVLAGVGSGIGTVSMQTVALESVSVSQAGVASGIYSTFRYIGSISGSALISLMVLSTWLHVGMLAGAACLGLSVAWGTPGLSPRVADPATGVASLGGNNPE